MVNNYSWARKTLSVQSDKHIYKAHTEYSMQFTLPLPMLCYVFWVATSQAIAVVNE